jgi:hypothetical protein
MATVIITAEDAYNKFLQGIRKVAQRTVPPDQFESWYADATLDWLRQKFPTAEFNQKRIDDMEKFFVVTDGVDYPIITGSANQFTVPSVANSMIGNMLGSGAYPLYCYGLYAQFKDANGAIFGATVARADQANTMLWDHYRKPTAKRCYFEYRKDVIHLLGGTSTEMILGYYRYPVMVSFTNSIDPETSPSQSEEIVQIAVRLFLENRGDPRYKSKLQEMMVTAQGK